MGFVIVVVIAAGCMFVGSVNVREPWESLQSGNQLVVNDQSNCQLLSINQFVSETSLIPAP